jgi:hypothetical protein
MRASVHPTDVHKETSPARGSPTRRGEFASKPFLLRPSRRPLDLRAQAVAASAPRHHCPNGRPTMFRLRRHELDKQLRRL